MVPPPIRRRFSNVQPTLEILERMASEAIFRFCGQNGFAYTGRTKTLESLAEKIETGRYSKWSELDDLWGCAIIVPTLDRERDVLAFLRGTFVEVALRERGSTKKDPSVFRFDATRFICRLRDVTGLRADDLLYRVNFEVQVRSAFEHAWVVTTYSLAYKSRSVDWKLQRLAAQLKAAVEQLDMLVATYESSSESIVAHEWPELTAHRLIAERFAAWAAAGHFPSELQPKDWSRFATNLFGLIRSCSRHSRGDPRTPIGEGLLILEREVASLSSGMMPRSISLLQFAFGVLAKCEFLAPPLKDYCPLVTDELLSLYPAVRDYADCFSLET